MDKHAHIYIACIMLKYLLSHTNYVSPVGSFQLYCKTYKNRSLGPVYHPYTSSDFIQCKTFLKIQNDSLNFYIIAPFTTIYTYYS